MNLLEILQKRHSCRSYLNKELDDKDVYKIISYAALSPSAGNLQPWHVIIVNDKEKRNSLSVASLNQTWMKEAPMHLVICGNEEYSKKFYRLKGEFYCKQDCAAFIGNMLLTATNLNLDTCWVGAFDEEMVKRELEIPENIAVYAIVTLGYCSEKNVNIKKRYDFSTFTFFEKYGNKLLDKNLFPLAEHIPKINEESKNIFQRIKNRLIKHSK